MDRGRAWGLPSFEVGRTFEDREFMRRLGIAEQAEGGDAMVDLRIAYAGLLKRYKAGLEVQAELLEGQARLARERNYWQRCWSWTAAVALVVGVVWATREVLGVLIP